MWKTVLKRCLLGAPLGLAIGTVITIVISLFAGDGRYYAVVPELITDCGSEINAVLLQSALSLVYGAAWAGASVIWQNERWSMLKQTLTHLAICSAATFPIAYFARWMPHNAAGVALYFGIFIVIYAAIWLVQYSAVRKRVTEINRKLEQKQD